MEGLLIIKEKFETIPFKAFQSGKKLQKRKGRQKYVSGGWGDINSTLHNSKLKIETTNLKLYCDFHSYLQNEHNA